MPNVGRPSSGCLRCIRRRVKCDEAKPACNKCKKLGKPCLGYRNETDILFVNQNAMAKRLAFHNGSCPAGAGGGSSSRASSAGASSGGDEARNPRGTPSSTNTSTSTSSTVTPVTYAHAYFADPSRQLQYSRDAHAVCLLVSSYVVEQSAEGSPGHLEFLPKMLTEPGHPSCLADAITAVGYANLCSRYADQEGMRVANAAYVKAIASTNLALQDAQSCVADGTLVASWMLGLYELITGGAVYGGDNQPGWIAHVSGMCQMLKLRGPQQLASWRGQCIFRLVHSQVKVQALTLGIYQPDEATDWIRTMFNSPTNTNTQTSQTSQMALYVVQVTKARAFIKDVLHDPAPHAAEIQMVLGEALKTEAFTELAMGQSAAWTPLRLPLEQITTSLDSTGLQGAEGYVDAYPHMFALANWNMYRATRIILHELIIRCLAILPSLAAALAAAGIDDLLDPFHAATATSPELLSTYSSPSSADSCLNLLPDSETFDVSVSLDTTNTTTTTPNDDSAAAAAAAADAATMMANSMSIIHAMAVDVARSIPFALCDIDRLGCAVPASPKTTAPTKNRSSSVALADSTPSAATTSSLARTCYGGVTILYPLRQLCTSPYIGELQRQTAFMARTRIAREFGIGAALRDVNA